MLMSPHLDSHSIHLKCYQLSKLKIEFKVIERMYEVLHMCMCAEKATFEAKTTKL